MKRLFVCALAASLMLSVFAGEAHVLFGGQLELSDPVCTFHPLSFTPSWVGHGATGGFVSEKDGTLRIRINPVSNSQAKFTGTARFTPLPDGRIEADYELTPDEDVALNGLVITTSFPLEGDIVGGTLAGDNMKALIPDELDRTQLLGGTFRRFSLTDAAGRLRLSLEFPKPLSVMAQDNRPWNSNDFSLRIAFSGPKDGNIYRRGTRYTVRFRVGTDKPLTFAPPSLIKIQAGANWVPLKVHPGICPGSALDFSKLRGTEAPAGKYGAVVARGQNFEFERLPGVSQRFYGVNVCGDANTPDLETSRAFAKHLARMGYNAIRFHHYEADLVAGSGDGTTLNPKQMDKFDGLVAACVENGIYMTTDLYVSRRPISYRSIGIDRSGNVEMDGFKSLVQVHEGAYSNFLSFARQLLGHVNPYTGRRLADEPAMAWLSLVNEGNLGNHDMSEFRKFPVWQETWKKWLAAKRAENPAAFENVTGDALPASLNVAGDPRSIAFILFLQETETRFAKRVTAFLRNEMKCRALTTNMNCWYYPAAFQLPRAMSYDYVDDHFYVDHPQFLDKPWQLPSRCPNRNPVIGSRMGSQSLTARRILDRPFTITEYNYSGPGRFRSVGGIALGAAGALQNWAGLWRFAWSHGIDGVKDISTKKMGYFDMSGDPLSTAAERASICLFLRRDLPSLKTTYAMVLPPADLSRMGDTSPFCSVSWTWASWYARIGNVVADTASEGARVAGRYPDVFKKSSAAVRRDLLPGVPENVTPTAGDGAVTIDPETGTFLLKTPRTCGGFAEKGVISAGALTAELADAPATVWVSSLNDRSIAQTDRLLLTHLTDVQNTDITYADTQLSVLLDWGRLPHLMRRGAAKVSLALAPGSWTVYVLSTDGTRRCEVPSVYADGVLRFDVRVDIDPSDASYLYEIVRK